MGRQHKTHLANYLIWYTEEDGNSGGAEYNSITKSGAISQFLRDYINVSIVDIENLGETTVGELA